jgi:hypothetical protein
MSVQPAKFSRDAPWEQEELAKLYAASLEESVKEKPLFQDLESFCLFVASGQSGHSLIGSLLDAHPRVIIAHQLQVLRFLKANFSKWQIFHLLLANSRDAAPDRSATGYSYVVPNQWQGKFEKLQVIGDKSGLVSEAMLRKEPFLLDQLASTVELPLKVIHAIRNPYDNISTIAKRTGKDLGAAARIYFRCCPTMAELDARLSGDELFHIRNEDLIEKPVETLRALCGFLRVDAPPDYLEASARIVYSKPHKSRNEAPWTPDLIRAVADEMERYAFLEGYSFEQ